jgi:hypothetical protein
MKERDNRPADVRFAEKGKKFEIAKGAVGGAVFLFSPALGLAIVVFSVGEHIALSEYVKWRMKGKQQAKFASVSAQESGMAQLKAKRSFSVQELLKA